MARTIGTESNNLIWGNAGSESIFGLGGDDTLYGFTGNDFLQGGAGNDQLLGEAGDDTLTGGSGNDSLNGGDGSDWLKETRDADMTLTNSRLSIYSLETRTFASKASNTAIPDGGTLSDTLRVNAPRAGVITDVNVTINLSHTWDQDLDIFLIAPDGTRVELTTDNGGAGQNYTDTVFDDEAATPVTGGTAPFSGSFLPEGFLSDFDGNDPNGIWTLEVTDDLSGFTGTLDSWSLEFTSNPLETNNLTSIEAANLTGGAGDNSLYAVLFSVPVILSGLAGNDTLHGGRGNDSLNGGTGPDYMAGGPGNDTYFVDSTLDDVYDTGGTDQINSSVNRTLLPSIENLTLTGTAPIIGTGNAFANRITGNASNNILRGLGGSDTVSGAGGNDKITGADTGTFGRIEIDTLTGGTGTDRFVLGISTGRFYDNGVAASPGHTDYARITDFNRAQADRLQLKGTAAQYLLGISPLAGVPGTALYHDSNSNGSLQPGTDELIAIIRSPVALTSANTINTAVFV